MDNIPDLCRIAVQGHFNLINNNPTLFKVIREMKETVGDPDDVLKQSYLNHKALYDLQYEDFYKANKQLVEHLKTIPERSIHFSIHRALNEGDYVIELDQRDRLNVKELNI